METKALNVLFFTYYKDVLKQASKYPTELVKSMLELVEEQMCTKDLLTVSTFIKHQEAFEIPVAAGRCLSLRLNKVLTKMIHTMETVMDDEVVPENLFDSMGLTTYEENYLLPKEIYNLFMNIDGMQAIKSLCESDCLNGTKSPKYVAEAMSAILNISIDEYVRLFAMSKELFEYYYVAVSAEVLGFIASFKGEEKEEYRKMCLDLLNEGRLEDILNLLKTFDIEIKVHDGIDKIDHEIYSKFYKSPEKIESIEGALDKIMGLLSKIGIQGKAVNISVKEGETKEELIARLKEEEIPDEVIAEVVSHMKDDFKESNLTDLGSVSNN